MKQNICKHKKWFKLEPNQINRHVNLIIWNSLLLNNIYERMFICVGCPLGHHIDEDHPFFCARCPKGTYNEIFDSPHCTHCPEGQTTPTSFTIEGRFCRDGKLRL